MIAKTKATTEKKAAKKPAAKKPAAKKPIAKVATAKKPAAKKPAANTAKPPKDAKPAEATKPAKASEAPKRNTPKPEMAPITQEMIAERAYHLWLAAGCPEGQETDLWLRAEAELCQENARP
jgi:hypothetical protein